MSRVDPGRLLRSIAIIAPALLVATMLVVLLQDVLGVARPSAVYLLAVVVSALLAGTVGAIAASIGSVLLFDYLVVEPRWTLMVTESEVWLSLLILLFVGIVVGHLAALQRRWTETARTREREAAVLFELGHVLSGQPTITEGMRAVVGFLVAETGMRRVWVTLGDGTSGERAAVDTGDGPRPVAGMMHQLVRTSEDVGPGWLRVHQPWVGPRPPAGTEVFRVRIESGGEKLGSIWALRDHRSGEPDASGTRLLAAAADHLAQALTLDHLAIGTQAGEVALQSDALRSALLQSVCHDLRTPLATIRAAAGTLRGVGSLSPEDRRESADAIDREVDHLNRVVTNMLDLGRIEAGALRAASEIVELDDIVGGTVDRLGARLGDRTVLVQLDVQPVRVDPMLLDGAVTNVLENVIKYTPPGTTVTIRAEVVDGATVRLVIQDDGPGVPAHTLDRLFDRFYRVPGRTTNARAGTGIGLAVARGLVEAMKGQVRARPGAQGGLAIELDLPAAATSSEAVGSAS
ncbi:MAG: DUF4118 domain-containing protein [Chloroflexi bacterium]|nr:DUF4118 domain-containing protein [Chloroflexota bacterium]